MNTDLYALGKNLYVNLTNRCTLRCTFCPKWRRDWTVGKHNLRLRREPSVVTLWRKLSALHLRRYDEVVFCGLGEPTLRLQAVLELGRKLRKRGVHVRLNTDGLANFRTGRDVTGELHEAVNELSVSLNAPTSVAYARLCPSRLGESAHAHVVAFLRAAVARGIPTTASVVATRDLDLKACRHLTRMIGVPLRVRPLDRLGIPR